MALTKISGEVIQTPLNVGVVTATEINAGIVTATTFSGNLTGNVTGNISGNATGLSGTPNITVGTIGATSLNASGIVTATSFSGDGSTLTGIAATTDVRTNSLVVSGVSTLGNTIVGGATTQLIVNGNARITGILTVGTSSVTINGSTNTISGVSSVTDDFGGYLTIPPGAVQFFARNTAPNGWMKANGANISRSAYAALFNALGTTFGTGDGSTTFTLPDMRGEFPRGWDDGRGADSARSFGTAQGDAIRNLTGFADIRGDGAPGAHHYTTSGTSGVFVTPDNISKTQHSANSRTVTSSHGIKFDAANLVPTAAENRPRNISLLACIKY
jgi:microcystin-dependent protein